MKIKAVAVILIILFLSLNFSCASAMLDVDCEDIKYGQNENIIIKLPGNARGMVNLNINNESYSFIVNSTRSANTILEIPLEIEGLKIGEYNVSVSYANMNANDSFSVTKVHRYSFNSSDLIKVYGNDSDFAVQVLADGKPIGANQNVSFYLNGEEYVIPTDNEGVAHLNIGLEKGNYIVAYEYKTYKSYNNIMVL